MFRCTTVARQLVQARGYGNRGVLVVWESELIAAHHHLHRSDRRASVWRTQTE
jgi:hypothetical protein